MKSCSSYAIYEWILLFLIAVTTVNTTAYPITLTLCLKIIINILDTLKKTEKAKIGVTCACLFHFLVTETFFFKTPVIKKLKPSSKIFNTVKWKFSESIL